MSSAASVDEIGMSGREATGVLSRAPGDCSCHVEQVLVGRFDSEEAEFVGVRGC